MAHGGATPPVPYTRFQEITVSACDKALASVSAYHHASTEEWNNTIINAILSTLVSETAPTSSDNTSQPSFKFVVNSTIIQHAPTAASGPNDPPTTGRRGMHAASGAYWNNEKDGMWSYKYSAAENKGLDVVVGIFWIWPG